MFVSNHSCRVATESLKHGEKQEAVDGKHDENMTFVSCINTRTLTVPSSLHTVTWSASFPHQGVLPGSAARSAVSVSGSLVCRPRW